ncbi:unnamed protein product [Parajaminaea phylloscopi]
MPGKQAAEKLISEYTVAVFSKSYCPYCKQAKEILQAQELSADKVGILELDQIEDGADIQAYLGDKTSQRTVPNIFIKGQHIGGCSDLVAAEKSGELKKLLSA